MFNRLKNGFKIGLSVSISLFISCLSISYSYGEDKPNPNISEISQARLSCKAEWNEVCEDKKIISSPKDHKICDYKISITQQSGDINYEITDENEKQITLYFRASGNGDRFKQQGAELNLRIALFGIKETASCLTNPIKNQRIKKHVAPAPVLTKKGPLIKTLQTPHACACSPWAIWTDVSNCLSRGHGKSGVGCETFEAAIQCSESKSNCRTWHKENCPQALGLNQSTSLKRLFIKDSPYCHKEEL